MFSFIEISEIDVIGFQYKKNENKIKQNGILICFLLTVHQSLRCSSIFRGNYRGRVKCNPNCIEPFCQSIFFAKIHGIQTSTGYRTVDGNFSVLQEVYHLHRQRHCKFKMHENTKIRNAMRQCVLNFNFI